MSLPKRLSLWKPQLDTLSKQPTFLILTFGKYLPSFLLLSLRGPPAPGERLCESGAWRMPSPLPHSLGSPCLPGHSHHAAPVSWPAQLTALLG